MCVQRIVLGDGEKRLAEELAASVVVYSIGPVSKNLLSVWSVKFSEV